MAPPVWVLSVDLQTKTATFTTGLADAAKNARSSFRDIQSSAGEMSRSVSKGALDVRHGIGLVDNTIRGAHSMAMVDMIRMFSDSALVMNALPFAMTVAGFALVAEIVYKGVTAYQAMKAAQEKLLNDTVKFGTANQDVWNGLDTKIIQAKKEADDLAGNHLAALHEQLMLIDRTSMEDLRHSFETVSKAADSFFDDLKAHWYQAGTGSTGAKKALDDFQTQYNSLLAQGKDEQASGLLHGTLAQAQEVLRLQQIADAGEHGNRYGSDEAYQKAFAGDKAVAELKKLGAGYAATEIESQRALVDALNDQVGVETRIAELKKLDSGNAVTSFHKQAQTDAAREAKARADAESRAERGFNQNFKQYEDERISITEEGSVQRVEATRQAVADAASLYGEGSAIYRHYIDEDEKAYEAMADKTLQAVARELDQEAKLRSEAAREAASNAEKMAELKLAAEKQHAATNLRPKSMNQEIAEQTKFANEEYQIKMAALQAQVSGLDQSGEDYLNKLKQLQDQERQLTQQHENELTAIRENAETQRDKNILASFTQFEDSVAQGLTRSIMGHQTWSQMVISLGDQVVSGMVENAIKSMLALDMTKEKEAAAAARKMYLAGSEFPFPANIVMGPTLAAVAFGAVMAFKDGGIVPGVGKGDTVPAMLTPGEGVIPGGVMDGLRNMARSGGFQQQGQTVHVHVNPTYHVNTIDGDGMRDTLEKHSDQLQHHFENTLRKMNR